MLKVVVEIEYREDILSVAKKALVEKAKKEPKFKVRSYSRCSNCGRRRGYYRKFKLCRICLRKLANEGKIPGVVKSSW